MSGAFWPMLPVVPVVRAGHAPDDVCITCSDQGVAVTIRELLPDGLAVADTEAGPEEISVALVEASVGDVVLVHAKEAIARLDAGTGDHGGPAS